jgi:hypothetical protein
VWTQQNFGHGPTFLLGKGKFVDQGHVIGAQVAKQPVDADFTQAIEENTRGGERGVGVHDDHSIMPSNTPLCLRANP